MPNAQTHGGVGAFAGGGVALAVSGRLPRDARLAFTFAAAASGYVGGLAPDILEPANNPWHRSACHSAAAGAGVLKVGLTAGVATAALLADAAELRARRLALPLEHPDRTLLWLKEFGIYVLCGVATGFAVGYLSHLALDAGTKRSIPLIARPIG